MLLFLEHYAHARSLRFIGEQVAYGAKGPLVDLLIVLGAHIILLPDVSHVAYHDGLDALAVQRRDESRGALVLDLFNLVFELLQLPPLGGDELLASSGASLLPVDLTIQVGDELVTVLAF